MLRSILAVWSLAFALLVIAATAGCDWGGCANGDDCSAGLVPGPDLSAPPDFAITCPTSCGTCAAGEICFQPSGAAELPAFCARPCADNRDCTGSDGYKCATLFASDEPAICITDSSPVGCAPASATWHCDLGPASCKDAQTALVPFSDDVHRVCGALLVHCAHSCAAGVCG